MCSIYLSVCVCLSEKHRALSLLEKSIPQLVGRCYKTACFRAWANHQEKGFRKIAEVQIENKFGIIYLYLFTAIFFSVMVQFCDCIKSVQHG